jgi:hypothetical protein
MSGDAFLVMAGLDPAIHELAVKTGMRGTSPRMTKSNRT